MIDEKFYNEKLYRQVYIGIDKLKQLPDDHMVLAEVVYHGQGCSKPSYLVAVRRGVAWYQ